MELGIGAAAAALVLAVIAGVNELIKRMRARDYWTALTIAIAVLIGFFFGLSGYVPGMDWVEGIVLGFGAAGVKTLFTSSPPTESKALPVRQ